MSTQTPMPLDAKPREGDLSLARIPCPRLGARLRRWLLAAVMIQAVLSALGLVALQTPWRTKARIGTLEPTAAIIADRLSEQLLHPANRALRHVLDSTVTSSGLSFAMIADAQSRVVMSSGKRDSMPVSLRASEGEIIATPLTLGLADSAGLGQTVVLISAMGPGKQFRLILGAPDLSGQRALLDGGVAIASGLAGTMIACVPLAFWCVRRSTGALRDLHVAIRRLAKGLPPDPVAPRGDDDVAYLGLAFNAMAVDILTAQRALQEANSSLERRVTERTRALNEANVALERNNRRLAEVTDTALRFTDDVAHDFRTPLAVILDFASLMQDGLAGVVSPEQGEHLGLIADAARELSSLVDDFLDTSRLRAGRLRVHRARHTVHELLESTRKVLQAKAAERRVTLLTQASESLPLIYADADRARRVIMNLAVNAIKFSREGGEVRIEASSQGGEVLIRVIDQGPGMSPQDVEGLFQRFRQTSTGRRASSKGFGLGLSIAAEFVSINLGVISVVSALGKGSTFEFTLPRCDSASILQHALERIADRDPSSGVRAFLVADSSGSWSPDQLCEHLTDRLRPHEVQVPRSDGRSVLVVGAIDAEDDWIARVITPETEAAEQPALTADLVGTWSLAEASPEVLARSILVSCAQEPVHA